MAEVIPVQWDDPEKNKIAYAADALRRGELIAVPTDTLYCILADPYNLAAVVKVYQAKSRAWDRSLPMFVDSVDQVAELARNLPSRFYLLAHRYWPGPLSLIVEASGSVPLKVTGNTARLSVRKPAAPIPLRLLSQFGMPLIATSANLSGFPTCKEASEVLATLGMHLSLIIDSPIADSRIATTVDLTVPKWRLIRQGAISEEELHEFLGE
ncbi:MAG: threonylcarbamoyl-AMP synthase [Acidobacteria bacterium]|nr:threonylcarbamoyl-AMP synthase [Acidobacteriota bacterium]